MDALIKRVGIDVERQGKLDDERIHKAATLLRIS